MSSTRPEVKVFVAGRFDKLTAGDIQFLRDAKALGTHLTVSFVSSEFVFRHDYKPSVLGDEHVKAILEALEMVDEVCIGRDPVDQIGLEFQSDFLRIKPDILAVSSLDKFGHHKRKVCESIGASYKIIPVSLPMVVPQKEVVVFVSGFYDDLHAGHIQFFTEAKALGTRLVVSFASSSLVVPNKERKTIPDDHKRALLESFEMIDEVCIGKDCIKDGLDFKSDFLRIKPDILVVTDDDKYGDAKRELCQSIGATYRIIPKSEAQAKSISSSLIIKDIRAPVTAPLRVDFAGAFLDVPRYAIEGGFIVNCSISPLVTKKSWPYRIKSGLGGSAAWALVNGKNSVECELGMGAGWQDPAVIMETGLCAWRSGPEPVLDFKTSNEFLRCRMALFHTGHDHDTSSNVDIPRDYDKVIAAGKVAYEGIKQRSLKLCAEAINLSYALQIQEGMEPLPQFPSALAQKYCGSGFGGYALYIFEKESDRDVFVRDNDAAMAIEPYIRTYE